MITHLSLQFFERTEECVLEEGQVEKIGIDLSGVAPCRGRFGYRLTVMRSVTLNETVKWSGVASS